MSWSPVRTAAYAIFACAAACAVGSAGRAGEGAYARWDQVPPAVCAENVALVFEASEFSDPAERWALERGAEMWFELSRGQVALTVVYDGQTPGAHHIHRLHARDAKVLSYERAHIKQPFVVMGWQDGSDVNIVINSVTLGQLPSLAAHELGHAAGLRWPRCFGRDGECFHSPDPVSVMAGEFSGVPHLTPSDLAFCRASCLCP